MNQDRMQQSTIQWECQQLLNRITSLTDQRDWEALAMCYTELKFRSSKFIHSL
jgi:hypothetical protein